MEGGKEGGRKRDTHKGIQTLGDRQRHSDRKIETQRPRKYKCIYLPGFSFKNISHLLINYIIIS